MRRLWGVTGAVVVIAAVLLSIRMLTAPRLVADDTFWYARAAVRFTGAGEAESTERAAAYMRDRRGDDTGYWAWQVTDVDPRYPAIFAARPLYPLLAAPLLPFIGLDALLLVSAAAGIACSAIVATAAHHLWHSATVAIAAGILVIGLPSGGSIAFAYADGVMLAAWSVTLVLAGVHLRRGGPWWAAAFGIGLAATFMAKPANGMLLALTIVVVATALVMFHVQERRRMVTLGAVAFLVTATLLAISTLLGFSGIGESFQDLATRHFQDPDVANPVAGLLHRDGDLLAAAPGMVGAAALPVMASLIGLGGLIQRRSIEAATWAATGASSLLLVLLHPMGTEIPRLVAPLWVSVALGYAGLISLGWSRLVAVRQALAAARAA